MKAKKPLLEKLNAIQKATAAILAIAHSIYEITKTIAKTLGMFP